MAPPTILQSFDHKLPTEPNIEYGFKGDYREFKSTVSSTVDTDATPVFLREDISVFKSIAERYLPDPKPFSPLLNNLPALEKTHRLDTEADVTRLSTLQLIHPVNIALQEIAPAGTKLVCGSEAKGKPQSRFDVQWTLYSADRQLLKVLAILEIKSTHVIHWEDFGPAEATEENIEAKKRSAISNAPFYSLLDGNAIWLAKQAAKYSADCTDVALFDWNSMFIFNYIYQRSTIKDGHVKGTFFRESGRSQGMTFRRLLFAFVARALKRYEIQRQR
ncbi:hypothetical protein DTO271D3_6331 [Paecilomyces variotii]|nr:hypothetical protein DTO212C5_8586 [Paecilomyces variotii]KAJ9313468.1 hypothetical protein DTO271D3_6331 [Paecilomyces variotii]KAJ9381328.1 hypothetical protein DTO063F5_6250 [Paecilomyces variotii]